MVGFSQHICLPIGPAGRHCADASRLAARLNTCWWALNWGYRAAYYGRMARRLLRVAERRGIAVSGLIEDTDPEGPAPDSDRPGSRTDRPGCEAAK